MQPYINPYLYQQYQQPQYNNQYSSYQQQYQQPAQTMSGRIVNDFSEITANDVPMDGSQAIFLKRDGSEIQTRSWNANGQITTTSYKPILDDLTAKTDNLPSNAEKLKNDLLDELVGVFDDRFLKLEKLIKPSRVKKEANSDE